MNKEYQEATNEYLRVCPTLSLILCLGVWSWEKGRDSLRKVVEGVDVVERIDGQRAGGDWEWGHLQRLAISLISEWPGQKLTYKQAQNSEPISGLSSEGYTGKGQVQSPPKSTK